MPSEPTPLTGKQRRHLRALGHHLDALVQIGKGGVGDNIAGAVDQALVDHELVKVKLGRECPDSPEACAEALSTALKAHVAQVLGGTILLYRRHPEHPKIKLPRAG